MWPSSIITGLKMPTSLETIRSVTIRGRTDGVDQATDALNKLTASIRQANDNLAKSNEVGRESDGFTIAGVHAATAANHLRQAAEAAYVFSPAFRGVVNEMRTPALAAASAGIEAVAVGLVRGTNLAGEGLIFLAGASARLAPQMLGVSNVLLRTGTAMAAFSPTAAAVSSSILGIAGTIVTRFLPVIGQVLLIYDALKLVGQGWKLAGQRIEEYSQISANAIGVSTDFYQRIIKGAESAKLPVDELTASFQRMKDALTPQLGGAEGLNRLKELTDAGNFKGNTGVDALKSAVGTQQQWEALVKLVHEAGDAGERLAAIDLTKSILGEDAAKNLSRDYDYLDKIKQQADSISGTSIIPDADIARAVEIQERFDAVYKTLSERWHPLQEVITNAGQALKVVWLNFLEIVASLITKLADAYNWAARLAALTFDKLKEGIRAAAGLQGTAYGPLDDNVGTTYDFAKRRLAAQLAQKNQVQRGVDELNALYSSIRGDKSKDPAKNVTETASAYDRATESVLKYIEVTKAEAATVGLSVAEQEKAKVVAQLTAAAMKDGLTPEAARAKAEMSELGEKAALAAEKLEKARIAADIKFNRSTALLSSQDVQIATALKGIYPDVSRALNSVEASAMRTNNALRTIGAEIENDLSTALNEIATGSKSAGDAFTDMGKAIVVALEKMIIQMLIIQPLMRSLSSFFGFGTVTGAVGPTSLGGAPLVNANGNVFGVNDNLVPFANGAAFTNKIVDSPTLFKFASGAALGVMGEAGPEAIMPLKRSANGALGVAASGGAGQTVHITYAPNNDFRGADAAVVAKLLAQQAEDQKKFEGRVQAVFVRMKNNHPNLLR